MVETFRIDDFTGGLNANADKFHLQPNESPSMGNVDVDPRGGVSLRLGSQNFSADHSIGGYSNGVVEQMFHWRYGGTDQVLLAVSGTGSGASTNTILQMSNSGTISAAFSGPSSAERLYDSLFAKWDGTTPYVFVGGRLRLRWNGTSGSTLDDPTSSGAWNESLTTSLGNNMPTARHVATHVDRLWVAYTTESSTDYPNRVRFSHPTHPEDWREDDYIDIVGGMNGVTALVPNGERLLVFKGDSIHAIYGYDTDTFTVVELANAVGVRNARQIGVDPGGAVYFFSNRMLLKLDGDSITDVSANMRPWWDAQNSWVGGRYFATYEPSAPRVSYANRKVWVSWAHSQISSVFVLNPSIRSETNQHGSWTEYTYKMSTAIVPYGILNHAIDMPASGGGWKHLAAFYWGSPVIRVAEIDVPNVYTDEKQSDGSTMTYGGSYTTGWIDLGSVSQKKMWGRPDIIINKAGYETDITIYSARDWQDLDFDRSGTVVLPDESGGFPLLVTGSRLIRGKRIGLARAVQLRIAGEAGLFWNVESITFKYNPRRVR